MIYFDIQQGEPEWFALRLGKVTASRVADVIARTKTGYSASRANYMAELLTERLTGVAPDRFTSPAMEWGKQTEAEARTAYCFYSDADVVEVAFADHPIIAMSGASPDGLVTESGLVEIKAPNTATHLETLMKGTIPGKYITQMQWQMACTGRQWCDFVSYDPRLPEELKLFVKRIGRDNVFINDMEREIKAFLKELDDQISELSRRFGVAPVIESVAIPATVAAGAAFPSPAAPYSEAAI